MHYRPASLVIPLCFGSLFFVCFSPALLTDRQFAYRDTADYYYPLYQRVQAEWNAGRWPLWEPEENAGMPLLGNPTAAVLYPGKLVFAVLPYAWGARIYIVAHSALAFASMYFLMRSWSASMYGSALSALAYAFGAPVLFQATNVIYLVGAAWLPLGVRAVDRWARLGRRAGLLELAIVLSMQILGGDIEAAYILGMASVFYVVCLAWTPARPTREPPDSAKPGLSRRFSALFVLLLMAVFYGLVTLSLARWLPRLRKPDTLPSLLRAIAWMPMGVNAVCGLILLVVLVLWWRRGRRAAVGVAWLGLAGSAILAAALTAAQLLPVIEFTQQTSRSDPAPHEVYRFSLDPCQFAELLWPNILGSALGGTDYWGDILKAPGGRASVWQPSLYLGALTVALALGSLVSTSGPPCRVWLIAVGALSALASLGQHSSPIWLARAVDARWSSAAMRTWLPDLGPPGPVDDSARRSDGYLHDSDASFYWWLTTVWPGFRQFRYPAKLFVLSALAATALAGLGWDQLVAGRDRGIATVFFALIVLSTGLLLAASHFRSPILESFRGYTRSSWLGPFRADDGYRAIIRGLVHSLVVLAVGFVVILQARRFPRWAGPALLIVMTLDLAAANARHVLTAPQPVFDATPEALKVIEDAERSDPSSGPFRFQRMWLWSPSSWRGRPSDDRLTEALAWDRDSLYPKYGINLGLEYTHTTGVGQIGDFERFFAISKPKVVDKQAARLLGIKVGEEVVYQPRRSYDLWNTRYIIVAFDSSGWRDPMRASASFLFDSRQIYPDPDRFRGQSGRERAKKWAETRDFKVIRNLSEYPRAWVVHRTRTAKPAVDGSDDAGGETLREMLYAADPIWNDGRAVVHDPHQVTWVNRADLARLRPRLSGLATGPSEGVTVTYPSPQRVVLEARLDSPGMVVLSDVYYPGWELTVDGLPAPIYQVNGVMRGATVPRGSHRLVYTYRPRSFRVGRLVSIAGVVALLILGLASRRWPGDRGISASKSDG